MLFPTPGARGVSTRGVAYWDGDRLAPEGNSGSPKVVKPRLPPATPSHASTYANGLQRNRIGPWKVEPTTCRCPVMHLATRHTLPSGAGVS